MSRGARVLTPDFRKIYLKKDVMPIIGVIVVAAGWMVHKGIQHLQSPDVFLNPKRRGTDAGDGKYDDAEGREWVDRVASHYRHKGDSIANVSAFEHFDGKYWEKRDAVVASPSTNTGGGKSYNLQ